MINQSPPAISVVTTVYNSSGHLEEFHKRMTQAIKECYTSYEFIFVNDGSADDTLSIAQSLIKHDPYLKVIDLTRNFGQHKALMAGIKAAVGKEILLIACDLEEQPEWLFQFKQILDKSDVDVIYGVQTKKNESFLKKLTSKLFYKVFNWLSPVKLTPNIILFRLMKRTYIKSLLQFEETVLFLPGVMEMAGHKQLPLQVNKNYKGSTSYNLDKLVHMAIDAITSFSTRPLTLLMSIGIAIICLSFLAVIVLALTYIYAAEISYQGYFILTSIWGATGLLMTGMGMVGLYSSRALIESKRRPQVIIKATYTNDARLDEA